MHLLVLGPNSALIQGVGKLASDFTEIWARNFTAREAALPETR